MDDTSAFLMSAGDGGSILSAVNVRLAEAGIAITREDALKLVESRNEDLAELERVEFGRPAVVAIAEAVAGSPLLTRDCACDTLSQLQDVFYAVRGELPVDVPDGETIEAFAICLDDLLLPHEDELTRVASGAA